MIMKRDYESRIQKLLSQMTLEEKIGQLQQCGPSLVGAFDVSFEELLNMMFDGRISQEEFGRLMSTAEQDYHEEDLRAGRIGSYNGVGDAATANRLQKIAVEETRLGIPLLFGYDVIHGFRTVTPIPLAESCAWEPELWEKTGRIAAKEATAAGIHMTFAPMVDVAKDARWGRISEGAGEDVLLNGAYGAAKVRGFQSDDLSRENAMAACVKHFAAYGAGEAGRDYNRVDMSLQRLWEEYLPAYKACVDVGARAVMPAFNDINGLPCSVNRWLLRDILRERWGFNGMVISDANAIAECVTHGIATDRKEAARQAILAGMDMDMTSNSYIECLQELVESGEAASRADITVSAEQMTLIRKLASTGKPVIVVLFNGRPLAIPELHELAAAVVEAWHPGVEAGNAILDILCGDVNPSGKLTTTFPAATGQCPMYYAHINTGRPGGKSKFTSKYLDAPIEPLYPFGYGLSYTTYAYTGRKVEKREDGIHVSMSVTNTGGRDGEEIVQCYVQQMTGRRVRPVRQLKDFTKISLKAGETKTVTFVIPYAGLSYYDWEMKEVPGEGIVKVYAGGDSQAELAGQVVLCRASDR